MQDFFSFILYPVSAILWFWHKIFGFVLSPDNGFAWALAIFFLVFTLRLLLIKPALSQLKSGRKMQQFSPQMQKVREKYKNDRQKQAEEMKKLQSEHGVNPVGGCLPALLQIPVFLSLVTVLRDFTYPASLTQGVFIFQPTEVRSFINAHIFGAKLGNWMTQSAQELAAIQTDRTSMMIVGIPLMIIASVATFFTMRLSINRQGANPMGGSAQGAMISKLMMYVAPLGLLVSGIFWPLGLLLYFLANNVWTLGQQHFLTNKVDRDEEKEKAKQIAEKKETPRPKPGQKPGQAKSGQQASESPAVVDGTASVSDSSASGTELNGAPLDGGKASGKNTAKAGASNTSAGNGGGKASGNKTGNKAGDKGGNGQQPGGSGPKPGAKKPQQKNRPGKAASAKKSQKKRR